LIGEQPYFDFATWRMPRGDLGKHLRWCLNVESQPLELVQAATTDLVRWRTSGAGSRGN
jgi:hypothetical protein